MINDIWGLKKEPRLAELAAQKGVPIALMSNQRGSLCHDIVSAVISDLKRAIKQALSAGVPWGEYHRLPGIGFGKTQEQNLEVLQRLEELKGLGRPILLGSSRKSFIGWVLDLRDVPAPITAAIRLRRRRSSRSRRARPCGFQQRVSSAPRSNRTGGSFAAKLWRRLRESELSDASAAISVANRTTPSCTAKNRGRSPARSRARTTRSCFGSQMPIGKSPDQPLDEGVTQFQIQTGDNGDVRRQFDFAAARLQPATQFLMIVDLAVADHHHAGFAVNDGLRPRLQTANRQPRGAEHGRADRFQSRFVRPAMRHGVDHRVHVIVRGALIERFSE